MNDGLLVGLFIYRGIVLLNYSSIRYKPHGFLDDNFSRTTSFCGLGDGSQRVFFFLLAHV